MAEPKIINVAKVTRDSIVIPKDVREKLGIKDGDKVIFKSTKGTIQIDEKIFLEKA